MGKLWKENKGTQKPTISTQMFQQETEASTLLGGDRLSADQKGKLWEIWSHFPESAAL